MATDGGVDLSSSGDRALPPVVYLPVATVTGAEQELQVELRRTRDGGRALLAYTALDRLVDCCGPQQPWVVVPTARLDDIGRVVTYEMILLDMPIPQELRHGAAADE